MKIVLKLFFILAIFSSFFLASWFAFHNTLHFHTDIARDFLLIEDMLVSHKPALIGPRSGGIPGVFHGPAWLYLNLPVYILSGGNPVATAWFWVFLTGLGIAIVYFVTKKLANSQVALGATALYSFVIAESASNLINPFGAVILSPFFLYFFVRYIQKQQCIHLIICLFFIGMIIQFQMAWGVPILVLSLPLLFRNFFIHKKKAHIFSLFILLIPLSTFILFDLRHQFLQIKSVISYIIGTSPDKPHLSLIPLLSSRVQDFTLSMFSYFTQGNGMLNVLFSFILIVLLVIFFRAKKNQYKTVVSYTMYFYVGFWILTLLFKGTMWGYYYWPFLPLFCIVFFLLIDTIFKKYSRHILVTILLLISILNVMKLIRQKNSFYADKNGYWKFFKNQADAIYLDTDGKEFGWYVYSADQYGYSPKYAMHYMQKKYPQIKGYEYQKNPLTYLIIFPSNNKYTSAQWWLDNQIKINKKPETILKFGEGSYVEKYLLKPEDLATPSDPNLIRDLMFR